MFASDREPWQNPRVLSILLLVFLAGACAGAFVMQAKLHNILSGSGRSSSLANFSENDLKRDLKLTPHQADQIKSVLDDFVKFNEDLKAQIEDTRATGKNRIMNVLDPEQKKQFEKLCAGMQIR